MGIPQCTEKCQELHNGLTPYEIYFSRVRLLGFWKSGRKPHNAIGKVEICS